MSAGVVPGVLHLHTRPVCIKNCCARTPALRVTESWEEWIDKISVLLAHPFHLPRKRGVCFSSLGPSHPPLLLFFLSMTSSFLCLFSRSCCFFAALSPALLLSPSCCYFLICSHNIHLFSADSFYINLNILPPSPPQPRSVFPSSAAPLPVFPHVVYLGDCCFCFAAIIYTV